MAAANSQQIRLPSYTHSGRRSEGGARLRRQDNGSAHGGKRRKAARRIGTHQRPPRRCYSSTRGSASGRARCWCSCGPRRSDSTTFSLINQHVPDITSPGCSCGERRQTVAHVILCCSKYKDLRKRIFANLSGRHSLRTILSTPQLATKAIEYMERTQILGQVGIRDT